MAAACFALFGDVRWVFVVPLARILGGRLDRPEVVRKVPAEAAPGRVSLCGVGVAVGWPERIPQMTVIWLLEMRANWMSFGYLPCKSLHIFGSG